MGEVGHVGQCVRNPGVYLASRAGPAGPPGWARVRTRGKRGAESHSTTSDGGLTSEASRLGD